MYTTLQIAILLAEQLDVLCRHHRGRVLSVTIRAPQDLPILRESLADILLRRGHRDVTVYILPGSPTPRLAAVELGQPPA